MSSTLLRMAAAVALATVPVVASAQMFSESYEFLKAVREIDGTKVTEMIEKPGSLIINSRDRTTKETALHIVARRSDAAYVRFFIYHKANVNAQDAQGETPLMIVSGGSCAECLDQLLKAKANVNLANSAGETPLIRAVQRRNIEFARRLLDAGANPDQVDVIAGRSARDYARLDTRTPALTKLLEDAPKAAARAVTGPRL